MLIARSTALHMSYTVSRATCTAVSASISTPVRESVSTRALQCTAGEVVRGPQLEVDARERQRVAERDEVGGPLGSHDARHARDGEHVSLVVGPRDDACERLVPHLYASLRHRPAPGRRLLPHVDHAYVALWIEVGELFCTHLTGCGSGEFESMIVPAAGQDQAVAREALVSSSILNMAWAVFPEW